MLLRQEAERTGDAIIKEHVDEESGGKSTRKQFQQLMQDAQKQRFDLVRVFALDRFSSEGMEAVFEHTATLYSASRSGAPAEYDRPARTVQFTAVMTALSLVRYFAQALVYLLAIPASCLTTILST